MANLDDLSYPSISEMFHDEAIELLRQIRLNRRTPVKRTTTTTAKKKSATPSVDPDQAAELLKLLIGGDND